MNHVKSFDILLFVETWCCENYNIDIDGYFCINCPRPKCDYKAKRNSGGVVVYCKLLYKSIIQVVDVNNKGIIWFKIDKSVLPSNNDAYFCICYIPPEDSLLYRKERSILFEFDF